MMLLATTEKEADDAVDNPKEFMNLALDVCDKQRSKTIKTETAKCLEAFADKVDGCISFISLYCIHAIDCYSNGNQDKVETHIHYSMITPFLKLRFFKLAPEIIIETCILSMTVISYLLPKRTDIIMSLDHMMIKDLDLLLVDTHVLIQARMALFFGYFSDILFKNNDQKFKQVLKFLFDSIDYPQDKIVVGHQSCETLTTLIGDKNLISRIKPLVSDITELCIKYIKTTNLSMFFDFFNDFVYIYRNEIKGSIVQIISALVER